MPKLRLDKMIWSHSRISSFEQCPLGWWYSYHYKINRNINNAFAEYGSLCHELIQHQMVFKQRGMPLQTNEEMKDYFQNGFYHMSTKFLSSKMKREYLYDGIDYFRNWDSFEGYNVKAIEEFTNWEMADYPCYGGMDLLLEKDDKFYLIDHKSSKPYDAQKMNKKIKQLYFYGPAVKSLFGKHPEYVGFNFFRKNKLQIFEWDTDKFVNMLEWFESTVKKIKATKDFVANPNAFFCNHICNHRFTCPKKSNTKKKPVPVNTDFEGFE
mgnify:CR=1 FL=1